MKTKLMQPEDKIEETMLQLFQMLSDYYNRILDYSENMFRTDLRTLKNKND
jgi:hypothetical protein